jgi:hypothetical protein
MIDLITKRPVKILRQAQPKNCVVIQFRDGTTQIQFKNLVVPK